MPSALLSYCFGEISLGVSQLILHQAIAIVKDQVGIDFDIPQSNLVGLQLISVVTNQIVMRGENRRIFARFRSNARGSVFLRRSYAKSSQFYLHRTVLIDRMAWWDRDVRVDMYNIRRRH
jgi:hypothetical protein